MLKVFSNRNVAYGIRVPAGWLSPVMFSAAMMVWSMAALGAETDTGVALPAARSLAADRALVFFAGAEGGSSIPVEMAAPSRDVRGVQTVIEAILAGETPDGEPVDGAVAPLPEGTILAGVEMPDPDSVVVRLDFPEGKLTCSCFGGPDSDRLTRAIQQSLDLTFDIHSLRILAKEQGEPADRYMDLVDRLMGTEPTIAKDVLDGTAPKPGEKGAATAAAPSTADIGGGFPNSTGNFPAGFLSGKGVFLNASHGSLYRPKSNSWGLQRGLLLELNEDIHNAELVSWFLATYLRNAGAQVWPEREMDFNTNMVIIDSTEGTVPSGKGTCTKTGSWTTTTGKGFKVYTPPLRDPTMPFRSGTGSYDRAAVVKGGAPTATAVFTPNLPAAGFYHVYISFVGASDQPAAAHIGVRHTGGESNLRITQKRDGNTWLPLGSFYFNAGQDAANGAVVVYNDVAAGDTSSYVCIDAVRFGGGVGEIQRYDPEFFPSGPWVGSNKPRWTEEARYYLQFTGVPPSTFDSTCYESTGNSSANQRDECDGWAARTKYVAFETETGEDTCYLGLHTNASTGNPDTATARGLSTYIGTSANAATIAFRDYVHDSIFNDVTAAYAPTVWRDSKNKGAYGENNQSNLGSSPGFLIELLFHDNTNDTNLYKDPKFRQLCARAMYKGIVNYYANRDGKTAVYLPEPPTHLNVRRMPNGAARVAWRAPASGGVNGSPATGYIVQHSLNGKGFDDGTATTQTYFETTAFAPGVVHYVRVIATNAGGISFPSEVLAIRLGDQPAKVLFVQGNDRVDRFLAPLRSWFGAQTRFMELRSINSFDYVIQHAVALNANDADFDSATNEAVGAGDIDLTAYALVIWAAGQQSEADTTVDKIAFRAFDANQKTRLRAYTAGGGNLFATGSEIWWDMDRDASVAADDRDFVKTVLKAGYAADDAWPSGAVAWKADGVTFTLFHGLSAITFDDGTHGTYAVNFPDVLSAQGDAAVCLRYQSATAASNVAGIQSLSGAAKVVSLGIPFETIYPESTRNEILHRVLEAMVPAETPTPTATPTASPSPTETPTATPTPASVRFDFTDSPEDWQFSSSPAFTSPVANHGPGDPGVLSMVATNSNHTFGFWESPTIELTGPQPAAAEAIPFVGPTGPDSLYTAGYVVRTDVTNPARVPQFRLRTTAVNQQQSTFLAVDSRGDGNDSPTSSGIEYILPFAPAPGATQFRLAFDMLNFDPNDAPDGSLLLDSVELIRRDVADVADATTHTIYTFAEGNDGWTQHTATSIFASPVFGTEPGALTVQGILGNAVVFGYWGSPETDVLIDPSRLYIVSFEVESDVAGDDRARVPQFRVRVNEQSFHSAMYLVVESRGDGARSPVAGEPQLYTVYYIPPASSAGQGLFESFDFLNFDPTDKSDAILKLKTVTIRSVANPYLP